MSAPDRRGASAFNRRTVRSTSKRQGTAGKSGSAGPAALQGRKISGIRRPGTGPTTTHARGFREVHVCVGACAQHASRRPCNTPIAALQLSSAQWPQSLDGAVRQPGLPHRPGGQRGGPTPRSRARDCRAAAAVPARVSDGHRPSKLPLVVWPVRGAPDHDGVNDVGVPNPERRQPHPPRSPPPAGSPPWPTHRCPWRRSLRVMRRRGCGVPGLVWHLERGRDRIISDPPRQLPSSSRAIISISARCRRRAAVYLTLDDHRVDPGLQSSNGQKAPHLHHRGAGRHRPQK